jgi:hypothetical protein
MIGSSFHSDISTSVIDGADVDVIVRVGTGVIGENCLGFCVAVACLIGAAAKAGNVCVGVVTGALIEGLSGVGTCVDFPAQEVNTIQIKTGINKRFIWQSIAGKN